MQPSGPTYTSRSPSDLWHSSFSALRVSSLDSARLPSPPGGLTQLVRAGDARAFLVFVPQAIAWLSRIPWAVLGPASSRRLGSSPKWAGARPPASATSAARCPARVVVRARVVSCCRVLFAPVCVWCVVCAWFAARACAVCAALARVAVYVCCSRHAPIARHVHHQRFRWVISPSVG